MESQFDGQAIFIHKNSTYFNTEKPEPVITAQITLYDLTANKSCGVEIHAISKGTYDFLVQAQAQINNGGLFATTPENVKTNFITSSDAKTKAVGWFSIATVSKAYKNMPN